MIAVLDIRENICIKQLFFKWFGNGDVINTPAFIVQPHRRKALAPPAVTVRLFMKFAEGIDPAAAQELCHPFPFLR